MAGECLCGAWNDERDLRDEVDTLTTQLTEARRLAAEYREECEQLHAHYGEPALPSELPIIALRKERDEARAELDSLRFQLAEEQRLGVARLQHQMDMARERDTALARAKELEGELTDARVRMFEAERQLAGAHGEIDGLRVTAGFFERRCEVLEAAAKRPLTKIEQDALAGCCPFCGVTVGEYVERITAERDSLRASHDQLAATCERMRAVVTAVRALKSEWFDKSGSAPNIDAIHDRTRALWKALDANTPRRAAAMSRLTDEQIERIERLFERDMLSMDAVERLSGLVLSALAELRARRADDSSHRVQIAKLADALPIDEEADRQVTEMVNKALAGQASRKLTMPALSAEEVEALRGLREAAEQTWFSDWQEREQAKRALAVLDRLIGTRGK